MYFSHFFPFRLLEMAFGTQANCASDYLELFSGEGPSRQLISRYCGNDDPAEYIGPSNVVQVRYVSSLASSGGWMVDFQIALTRGEVWQEQRILFSKHLTGLSGSSPQSGLRRT